MQLGEQTIEQYLSNIASENVSPAGGSAVAIAGATGASLCEMTCIHKLNSNRTDVDNSEITAARDDFSSLREELLQLADRDAQVIEAVYSGPSQDVSQTDIKRSLGVPLAIAESCLGVIENGTMVVEEGDHDVVADAKTGILLARASVFAAILIVNSNLDHVSDQSYKAQIERRVGEIMDAHDELIDDLSSIPYTDW